MDDFKFDQRHGPSVAIRDRPAMNTGQYALAAVRVSGPYDSRQKESFPNKTVVQIL